MKNKKIEIPDYTDIDILEDEDLIKLGDTILEVFKLKLGTTKLFVVYKWSDDIGYVMNEASIEDICFSRESFRALTDIHFKNIYGTIYYIFKDKEKAEKYCDNQNIDLIKKNISKLEKEIENCNPIKAMERVKKEQDILVNRYMELKEKLYDIEKAKEESDDN